MDLFVVVSYSLFDFYLFVFSELSNALVSAAKSRPLA
jgi:hypothetical protein